MPKKKAAKNFGPQSLLVELLTEELPPKALKDLSEAFSDSVEEGLRNRGLLNSNSAVTSFATPRRLAVCISNILAKGADKSVEQKLMPLSAARAADGTLSSEALQKSWQAWVELISLAPIRYMLSRTENRNMCT